MEKTTSIARLHEIHHFLMDVWKMTRENSKITNLRDISQKHHMSNYLCTSMVELGIVEKNKDRFYEWKKEIPSMAMVNLVYDSVRAHETKNNPKKKSDQQQSINVVGEQTTIAKEPVKKARKKRTPRAKKTITKVHFFIPGEKLSKWRRFIFLLLNIEVYYELAEK